MPPSEEQSLVESLLAKRSEISLVIPDDFDPTDLHRTIKICCTHFDTVNKRRRKVGMLIGRLMVLVQRHPEVWGRVGYDSYEDYCQTEVYGRMGLERSQAQQYKTVVEKWGGSLKLDAKVKVRNLMLVGRFSNESETGHQKYLKAAIEKPYRDLQDWLETQGQPRDTTTGASVRLTGSLADVKDIYRFLKDQGIAAIAGKEPLKKILAAAAELYSQHEVAPERSMAVISGTPKQIAAFNEALAGVADPIEVLLKALGVKQSKWREGI